MNNLKDWIESMALLVIGNSLYNVVPVWITQYLLTLPNPFYSIGYLLHAIPTINLSSYGVALEPIKQYVGVSIIGYAVYLIAKMLYKK